MEHWQRMQTLASVTSYAEVWIEISHYIISHPAEIVTSYAEVWIEIGSGWDAPDVRRRHLLRGGVD